MNEYKDNLGDVSIRASAVESFLRCGEQYRLRKAFKGNVWTRMLRGRAFHLTVATDAKEWMDTGKKIWTPLQDLHGLAEKYLESEFASETGNIRFDKPYVYKSKPKSPIMQSLTNRMPDGTCVRLDDYVNSLQTLRNALTLYSQHIRTRPDYRPEFIEQAIEVTVEYAKGLRLRVTGTIDLVVEPGFWEYKITQKQADPETHIQFLLYSYLLRNWEGHPNRGFFGQINPMKTDPPNTKDHAITPWQEERLMRNLWKIAKELTTGEYHLACQDSSLSWACKRCEVSQHCEYTLYQPKPDDEGEKTDE